MVKNRALIIVIMLAVFLVNPTSAFANPCELISPECTLRMFIESVRNGQSNEIVGVIVPGLFASPVVQQPKGESGFVSNEPNEITQHAIAEVYGVIGLLAHNAMNSEKKMGEKFYKLERGNVIVLVMGDGMTKVVPGRG